MTDTNAPERIWACRYQYANYWADGDTPYVTSELVGQYVHADLFAALEAQIATLTAERDAAVAANRELIRAADYLSICAQTTGGTAGRDNGLVAAVEAYGEARFLAALPAQEKTLELAEILDEHATLTGEKT